MSLFQCENCGCCENTALSCQGFIGWPENIFDWSYAPELKGMKLCSACGPTHYSDGEESEYGKWHEVFTREYLPMGMFITNRAGNLEHKDNGDDHSAYVIRTDGNIPNAPLVS